MSKWQPIETSPKDNPLNQIDIWMEITPCALSMGMGDSFRVPDCYFKDDKWYHMVGMVEKALDPQWMTHWRNIPKAPKS